MCSAEEMREFPWQLLPSLLLPMLPLSLVNRQTDQARSVFVNDQVETTSGPPPHQTGEDTAAGTFNGNGGWVFYFIPNQPVSIWVDGELGRRKRDFPSPPRRCLRLRNNRFFLPWLTTSCRLCVSVVTYPEERMAERERMVSGWSSPNPDPSSGTSISTPPCPTPSGFVWWMLSTSVLMEPVTWSAWFSTHPYAGAKQSRAQRVCWLDLVVWSENGRALKASFYLIQTVLSRVGHLRAFPPPLKLLSHLHDDWSGSASKSRDGVTRLSTIFIVSASQESLSWLCSYF